MGGKNKDKDTDGKQRRSTGLIRKILIGVFIVVLGGVIVTVLSPIVRPPRPQVTIKSPHAGGQVDRTFHVVVELRNVRSHQYLWLATKAGDRLWPKVQVSISGHSFDTDVSENGPSAKFGLVVFEVKQGGQDEILHWFDNASESGSFPGIQQAKIPGFFQWDCIDLTLKPSSPAEPRGQ